LDSRIVPGQRLQSQLPDTVQQGRRDLIGSGHGGPFGQEQGTKASHLPGHHPLLAAVPDHLTLPGQPMGKQFLDQFPTYGTGQVDVAVGLPAAAETHRHQ
jgi:hypothetical protein